ncbi:MAG TPA: hypothetical protein PLP17_08190 [Oligoflexia bacterium]|nr:hypothetical protein [Oligoflexia bacterium]
MAHDDTQYADGPSLMWSRFVPYASAFSAKSLAEAENYSGTGLAGGNCFAALSAADSIFASDDDGDGIANDQELRDRTDGSDSGSLKATLRSPVYAMWNSFLKTTNIAEIVNPTQHDIAAYVSLHALDGALLHQRVVPVAAFGQFDLIVNDLPGFIRDSYGLLKIEFSGVLDGRMSYYRQGQGGDEFEFAYSIPFSNPLLGKSAVAFNTFQPSTNPAEAANYVANWLTIVNLSEQTKAFTVFSFNAAGAALRSLTVEIPGFGRIDVDGGHGFAGAQVVGFHQIIPADSEAAYQAQLIRYGGNARPGENATEYFFAYPLLARAGASVPQEVFISASAEGEENWLELVNTSTKTSRIEIQFNAKSGSAIRVEELTLKPHEQRHLPASQILEEAGEKEGTVVIRTRAASPVIAQSMFYYRNEKGSISTMFGLQAREALGELSSGSYNLFLGMENRLRIANTSDAAVDVAVQVSGAQNSAGLGLTIPARGCAIIPIAQDHFAAATQESYGLVTVESSAPNALISELLRVRKIGARVDFISATALRP